MIKQLQIKCRLQLRRAAFPKNRFAQFDGGAQTHIGTDSA
jgi:hypothetical protein